MNRALHHAMNMTLRLLCSRILDVTDDDAETTVTVHVLDVYIIDIVPCSNSWPSSFCLLKPETYSIE